MGGQLLHPMSTCDDLYFIGKEVWVREEEGLPQGPTPWRGGMEPRATRLHSLSFVTRPTSLPEGTFQVRTLPKAFIVKGCMHGTEDSPLIHMLKICHLKR